MLNNYFKIAWRNLSKNKAFSMINIIGLAIGFAACLLIFQYVSFELSYDQFHNQKDDIYRVYLNINKNGRQEAQSARVSPVVATAFQNEFPGIHNYSRLVVLGPDGVLTYEDRYTGESDILLADTAFFDVFSYNLLRGNKETAFNDPFCVVITENTAEVLFGEEDPLGKSVIINAKNFDGTSLPFKVTGVVKNFPANSHLQPGVLISYPTLYEFVGHRFDNSWQWNETYTYFRLHQKTDPKSLEAQFPEVVHHVNEQLAAQQLDWEYKLQPVTDIHLHSDLQHEVSANGNAFYVYCLLAIGMLIILIAYINFVNLVTVQTLQRAKEIGVRKVSGAFRGQLIFQIFLEAILSNAIALLIGLLMLWLASPYLSYLFDIQLNFVPNNPPMWIGFSVFVLLLVLGSGFYPAFILSRYEPAKVLKGNFSKGKSGTFLRKSLVTGQFMIALVLIAITLIAGRQISHMQRQSLGFNPEQILVIKSPKAHDYGYGTNFSGFQSRVSELAQVKNASGSNVVPGQEIYWYDDQVTINGKETSGVFSMIAVAANYFSQYNIPLITGRLFSEGSQGDDKWIINESAIRLLGFENAEQAIGQQLNNGEIIGVVKDFHHESLKTAIPPILFNPGQEFNYYTVRLETNQMENAMAAVKDTYAALFPGSPYEYFFLDEFFNRQYKADQQFNILFRLFSGLAIFINCLGLFGLSSFTATQRTKEIGIRKISGASVGSIVILLSRDIVKLILIGSLLALPMAYLVMQKWLENYASRIEISWWLLVIPVVLVLLIAFLTVCLQTVRAALTNPTQSLRYE